MTTIYAVVIGSNACLKWGSLFSKLTFPNKIRNATNTILKVLIYYYKDINGYVKCILCNNLYWNKTIYIQFYDLFIYKSRKFIILEDKVIIDYTIIYTIEVNSLFIRR